MAPQLINSTLKQWMDFIGNPTDKRVGFFKITLINELGGEFWLIITSGGSETTGTSDD